MSSSLARLRPWSLLLLLVTACAELEKERVPTVTTSGAHALQVGAVLQLSATTADGADSAYTWQSESSDVATVDAEGRVTAIAPGETIVTATGVDTGAVGRHPIVVVQELPIGPDGGVPPEDVPFFVSWAGSPHADVTAPAFSNWNEDGSVPVGCARCHSSDGYVDFLGGDGTAPGSVESPGTPQAVVGCATCHDPAASALDAVSFPSGKTVTGLGAEARCMVCHQGRASGADVDRGIAQAGITDEDTQSPTLAFTNIHYFPAAATLYAGRAEGGYQYPGETYDTRFRHVPGFDQCQECHDPHSTQVRWEACNGCHPGATDVLQARNIRQIASRNQDYDGDGNRSEGIYFEIEGLRNRLLEAIQRYGAERATRVCFANAHPYWFNDTDGDGACSAEEAVGANRFASWSPRLQKAAYNFQLSRVDPGNFAHNAKYVIQLLHDSLQSVNQGLTVPFTLDRLVREDPGHFNGASQAARNWDANEEVQASCSRCHGGAEGFRFFVQYGTGQSIPETANGLECATCHESFEPDYRVFVPAKTWLPDGKTLSLPGQDNLCANCHIGRTSKATLDAAIAAGGTLRFQNVHYLPAAGTREGTLAKIGYEYPGKTYAGRLQHMGGVQCTSCHSPGQSNHTFLIADVWKQRCETCHADADGPEQIRLVHLADYDGDGNTTETLQAELQGMAARVLAAMQAATANGLCYDAHRHPYFFKDTNGDRSCSATEAVASNGFTAFTPALLKASHNFQLATKEPGAWAHNFDYMGQLLYDSVEDLTGATPAGLLRP